MGVCRARDLGGEDHAVRNAWALFNFRESPFFQEPLQAGTRYPLSLFVGRTSDSDRLLAKIARSPGSSRQTVRGAVGVGKSTLAQHVKAEVAREGLISTPAAVSVGSALSADQLCALILRSVLDACLGAVSQRPGARRRFQSAPVVRQGSQRVRIYQPITGKGGGISAAGFGGNVSKTRALVTPNTATPSLVVQTMLQQFMQLARDHLDARAILVHLNASRACTRAPGSGYRPLRDLRR